MKFDANDNAVASSHITSRPVTAHEAILRLSVRPIIRSSALLWLLWLLSLLLVCLLPYRSVAQSTTSLLPDATVLPRRAIRFRGLMGWTRYDALFSNDSGSPRNLAASFAADSLGPRQIPSLGASETAIRALSGLTNFRLTAGQLVSAANSRVLTAPLIIEYGLSSRLSLGVVVPVVETRSTVYGQLNPRPGSANVGPNPALTSPAALAANAALVQSLTNAAAALQTRLSQCQAAPTTTDCSTLLAQQTAATSLIQSSGAFATALTQQYGTDATSHPGRAFVPLATDPTQLAINAKIADFKQQYQGFLNSDVVTGSLAAAGGPAARAQMQALLASFGYDSLRSTDRASIGDISIGATYQLANSFGDTTSAGLLRYRLALNGTFRIGTGEPAGRNRLFDVATGYGQPGVEGSVAADIQFSRRFMVSGVGSYTAQMGSVDVSRVANPSNSVFPLSGPFAGTYSAGNVMMLTIIPRWRLAGYFGLNGFYSLVRTAAEQYTLTGTAATATGDAIADVPPVAPSGLPSATGQQIGLGFSYSTVGSSDRGPGRIPFEVSFSHLETLMGSGGPVAKTFRDQIELRVYVLR